MQRLIKEQMGYEIKVNELNKNQTETMKGIAICLVISCHVLMNYLGWLPIGAWGVSIFLFCSGFGLEKSYQNKGLKNYWKRRMLSVYLWYIPFEIIYLCCWDGEHSIIDYAKDFLLIKPLFGFGWYLNYIIVWYFIFFVITKVIRNQNARMIIFGIISVALFILWAYTADGVRLEQSFFFFAGVFCANYSINHLDRWFFSVLVLGVGLLLLKRIALLRPIVVYLVRGISPKAVAVLLVVILGVMLAGEDNIIIIAMNRIGKYSFELYLMHGLFFNILQQWENGLLGLCVFFVSTILCAVCYNKIMSKAETLIGNLWLT